MLFEQDHVACVHSAPGGKALTIILNFMPGGLKTNWGNLIRSKMLNVLKFGIFEGTNIASFGCFRPLLPTRSNIYGSKWLVQVSRMYYYIYYVGPAPLEGILCPKSQF